MTNRGCLAEEFNGVRDCVGQCANESECERERTKILCHTSAACSLILVECKLQKEVFTSLRDEGTLR